MTEELKRIIGEAIGEASMLWSETPNGIFESDKAAQLVDRTVDAIHSRTLEPIDDGKLKNFLSFEYLPEALAKFKGIDVEDLSKAISQRFGAPTKTYDDGFVAGLSAGRKEGPRVDRKRLVETLLRFLSLEESEHITDAIIQELEEK